MTDRDTSADAAIHASLARAVELHQEGRLEQAEKIYRDVLAARPDDPDAIHFLGVLMYHAGRGPEAVDWIRRAIALRPDHAETHNNLGNVLKEQGRPEEAVAAYERAIELDPAFASAYGNLASALRRCGRPEQAVAAYDWAVAIDPDNADVHFNRGQALRSMGRFEEARVALYRALALRPDHALASRSLGQVLYRLGRTDEARRVFRQWLEHDPDNPIARHLFAACGGNAPPERASDAYVESLFDGAAPGYDDSLRDLDYRVPELIASLLAERVGKPRASLEVLDAGCGTGLCGPTLRPYASRLAGVDLSAAMLERAGELGLYDELIRAELTAHLRQREAAYDLVVAADTLVYFGELRTILAAAAASLRPGGSLAFSVERTDEESDCGYRLATHGRYSHLRSYLEREISQSGLSLREILTDVLRTEVGQPVRGWIVLARKDTGAGAAG